ncbi:hypothetical protein KIN20_029391 [Parelaphostrongylus tenuis]|uniref:Uncharacterized protein n=1 Tax=Parelaphostrongylus tenuis TaxID=148309 RepID=A0AAD5R2K1_PARTN|nr:hypothetical protein KIN20_029391 [Parelaphostrongylus tenuis]
MYRLREIMRDAERFHLTVGPLRVEQTEETLKRPACDRCAKHQSTKGNSAQIFEPGLSCSYGQLQPATDGFIQKPLEEAGTNEVQQTIVRPFS